MSNPGLGCNCVFTEECSVDKYIDESFKYSMLLPTARPAKTYLSLASIIPLLFYGVRFHLDGLFVLLRLLYLLVGLSDCSVMLLHAEKFVSKLLA